MVNMSAMFSFFDEQAVPGARFEDLDEALWRRFLRDGDEDPQRTLRKLRVLTEDEDRGELASVAGVLMCSRTPERWLPNARIGAARYRGNVFDSRYQVDRDSITGPADEQIRRAVAFAERTMRYGATKKPYRKVCRRERNAAGVDAAAPECERISATVY
jgi:ATP-dependent DNA helicase RecG